MPKTKLLFFFIGILCSTVNYAQNKELKGFVIANADLEGIHVLNTTSKINTTTNQFGAFTIPVKQQDIIIFSSVQYKRTILIVSQSDIDNELFTITLEDHVNELNEVIVGKVLTGNLSSDIANSDVKRPINFYDLGIPGYTGKPLTRQERTVHDADYGKYIYYGLGFAINVNKVLNKISGRTKKLKQRVIDDEKEKLLNLIKNKYSESFFGIYKLAEEYQKDFFYFCAEQDDFLDLKVQEDNLKTIVFLEEQWINYIQLITANNE